MAVVGCTYAGAPVRRKAKALCIRGVNVLEKTLKKVIAFMRGGTSTFNESEMLLLESTLKEFPDQDAQVFLKQIASVSLVQRQHPGRLVAVYYPKNKHVPQLPYGGYEYCLAKVSYRVNGKMKTTNLVLHDGRFMTFERNVPLKSDNIESIAKVLLHPGGYEPVAEEIDGEEHGENA